MTDTAQIAAADAADRHRSRLAVAALSMSCMFFTRAVSQLVDPAVADNLDYLVAGFALLMLVLIAPTVLWKIRNLRKMPQGERAAYFSADGFVNDVFKRAQRVSWSVTFLLLIFVDAVAFDRNSSGYLTTLPVAFYLQALVGLMLAVMATVFLVLNRTDGADDVEDGARA